MSKKIEIPAVLDKAAPMRLLQAMRYLGLNTKGEFAEWAGRSAPAASDWFNGTTPVPLDVALKIKATKHISLDWLYAGDDSGQTPKVTAALAELASKENPKVRQLTHQDRRERSRKTASK